MKVAPLFIAVLTVTGLAQADFTYRVNRKTGGAMASLAGQGPQVSTYYFKGQKMKTDDGNTATILDFDAQTITTVSNGSKTYSVKNFSDVTGAGGSDMEAKIDVKETGQKKMVNGFMASEIVMTMQLDIPQARQMMGDMRMELDMWISPDVPGAGQMRDFYQRNAAKFPWAAMARGTGPGTQKGMADMQRKMASMNGVQVESVMRIRQGGGAAGMPEASSAQSAQIAQARAKLQAMIAQGGPQAAAMQQMLDRMPGGAPAGGSGSGAMLEITMDSSDFSTASVPDSVFAVPAGYTKGN